MKIPHFIIFACLLLSLSAYAQVQVQHPLCENRSNPLGIDHHQPRFSWQLISGKRNAMQTAYELQVSSEASMAGKALWNSGKIMSDQSVFVAYAGPALESAKKYFWRVRVWDNDGKRDC
jgi:alpha-L-rhamnosidase